MNLLKIQNIEPEWAAPLEGGSGMIIPSAVKIWKGIIRGVRWPAQSHACTDSVCWDSNLGNLTQQSGHIQHAYCLYSTEPGKKNASIAESSKFPASLGAGYSGSGGQGPRGVFLCLTWDPTEAEMSPPGKVQEACPPRPGLYWWQWTWKMTYLYMALLVLRK